ncbi:hypothetical protein D917_07664, partial [Trichinella nativa]
LRKSRRSSLGEIGSTQNRTLSFIINLSITKCFFRSKNKVYTANENLLEYRL